MKRNTIRSEKAKREKLIRFIKSSNPFYAFTSFDGHSVEQLKKIKDDIILVIKLTAKKISDKNK